MFWPEAGSGFGPGRGLPYKSDGDARCFTLGCKLQISVSLTCLGWKVTILAHSGMAKKFTKNALTLTTQKSPFEDGLSLSHTHIGPPGFNLNFPMSIPVTFIRECPRGNLDNYVAHPLQEFLRVSPPPSGPDKKSHCSKVLTILVCSLPPA